MRLALISDIHGNPIALDAVTMDVERSGGADAYYVLGDLSAIGFDPVGTLERLSELPDVRFIRGNTDRYVVTGERPKPTIEDAQRDPSLIPLIVEITNGFAWTRGALAVSGWLDWTASLPLDLDIELPDGTRVHCVHASPGNDDGRGIQVEATDDELARIVGGLDADVLCVGHTHRALDRTIGAKRVVNLGSVSNPNEDDRSASYVAIEADETGHTITHRRVAYDYEAVLKSIDACGHPNPDFLSQAFRR